MTTYTISEDGKSITCHKCGKTSHNLNDVKEKYCGFCHYWHNPDPLPSHTCPVCGYTTDYATCMDNPDKARPAPGDTSVCMKCGEIFVFTETLDMRQAGLDDMLELEPRQRDIIEFLQAKIRERRPVG